MPSGYDQYDRRRRQTYANNARGQGWGHWLPLAITFTLAAGGLAAWVWKERKDHEEEDETYYGRPPPPTGSAPPTNPNYGPPPGSFQDAPPPGFPGPPPSSGQPPYAPSSEARGAGEESFVTRMSGALRRTPSPQQILDGASKRVAAGVAAAGAAVGGALSSITEEDRRDFEDHRSWSEEAESQSGAATSRRPPEMVDNEQSVANPQSQTANKLGSKGRSVAIVVSAASEVIHDEDTSYHQEDASILSHLPEHISSTSKIFVLIYDPDLKQHPLSTPGQDAQAPTSMTSSYSNIGHEDAQTPPKTSPQEENPRSKKFDTLYTQAKAIVDKETMIMPFTTLTGFIPMLRHLGPETVYLQANLAGDRGEQIDQITSWVSQVVVVVGDDSGHGGLVDSEDEHGNEETKWWTHDSRIGLGKGVEVVDGLRVGEDFRRRVVGHD